MKAFRLMVNRSVTWADWDEELLTLEIQELQGMDLDLALTGFDAVEIDGFLFDPSKEQAADAVQEVAQTPVAQAVICDFAVSIESCAAMRQTRKRSAACSPGASLGGWSRTRRMASNSIPSGAIGRDSTAAAPPSRAT